MSRLIIKEMIHMIHFEYMILALVVIASTFLVANAMVDTTTNAVEKFDFSERVDALIGEIENLTNENKTAVLDEKLTGSWFQYSFTSE